MAVHELSFTIRSNCPGFVFKSETSAFLKNVEQRLTERLLFLLLKSSVHRHRIAWKPENRKL